MDTRILEQYPASPTVLETQRAYRRAREVYHRTLVAMGKRREYKIVSKSQSAVGIVFSADSIPSAPHVYIFPDEQE